jgi:hypothetical protein
MLNGFDVDTAADEQGCLYVTKLVKIVTYESWRFCCQLVIDLPTHIVEQGKRAFATFDTADAKLNMCLAMKTLRYVSLPMG